MATDALPAANRKDHHTYVAQSERKEYGASWHTCTCADAEDEPSSSSRTPAKKEERGERGQGREARDRGGRDVRGAGARDERGEWGGRDWRGE